MANKLPCVVDSVIRPMLSEQLVQGSKLSIQVWPNKPLEVHPLTLNMCQLGMAFHTKEGEVAQLSIKLIHIGPLVLLLG